MVAGLRVTVAMPDALVKAVALGLRVAKAASVLNVTTVFGTTAPAASLKVAVKVAGAPLAMEVTAAPAELASASVKLGAAVVTGVVPGLGVVA